MSLDLFEIAEAVAVEYHLSKLAKKDFNFGVDGYDKRNQIWKDKKSKNEYMLERVDAKNSDRFYKPVLKLKQQEILRDKNFQNFVPKDKFLDTLENGYFSVISAGANPNNDDHKNMINKFPTFFNYFHFLYPVDLFSISLKYINILSQEFF